VIVYWLAQRRVIILHDSTPDRRTYSPVLALGRLLTGAVIPRTLVTSESYPESRTGSPYPMEPSWLLRTSPVRIAGKEYP